MPSRASIMGIMRKLNTAKRTQVVAALIEGNSVASTVRMCGVNKRTVLRLLADLGKVCAAYHDLTVRNVKANRVQVDEIWSFVGCKQKTKESGGLGDGDAWVWIAVDADSKLCLSYLVGLRDSGYATEFVRDVADRLANRIQLTSDGLKLYIEAVEDAFGGDVDYAQLIKLYGAGEGPDSRYSPAKCIGCERKPQTGNPDPAHISTSYIERQNLTVRMSIRRFTRLTNAFSKKLENHEASVALHYFYYNFIRVHQTIRTTPAIKAGLTTKRWTAADLVTLLEAEEARCGGGRIKD